MKAIKNKSLKKLASFSIIIVFVTNVYAQPGNKAEMESNTNSTKSTVEKPEMNIQTAILSDNLEIVKQHIAAGTDLNIKDMFSGSTPLITAATFGRKDIAKALIDANAELDIKNNEGSTALHAAAFFCHIEIVQMLLDAGADKTIQNNYGATARGSVIGAFSEMKPVYEMIQKQLEPLGLKLDFKHLELTRPMVAVMLQ